MCAGNTEFIMHVPTRGKIPVLAPAHFGRKGLGPRRAETTVGLVIRAGTLCIRQYNMGCHLSEFCFIGNI